jgi:hypothetical protein
VAHHARYRVTHAVDLSSRLGFGLSDGRSTYAKVCNAPQNLRESPHDLANVELIGNDDASILPVKIVTVPFASMRSHASSRPPPTL